MRTICWLHISDIHLLAREVWSQDVVLTALCEHAAQQRKEGTAADFILATGDIAFSGKAEEYALAMGFFDALVAASGVPRERIFCIPGNHDIDRDRQKMCFRGCRSVLQDQNHVDALLAPGEDLDTLLLRQRNFRRFQEEYFTGQQRTRTADGLAYVSRVSIDDVRVAVVGLDSAWLAEGGLDDHGKLLIGERQVINALRLAREYADPPHIIVSMAHHPFHLLSEFDRRPALDQIERYCHFFHCGHLHDPEARSSGRSGFGCLSLAAGASFETRQSHNSYSSVSLDLLRASRMVRTIHYVPGKRSFSAVSSDEYRLDVTPAQTPSVTELADAISAYSAAALAPSAHYLAALLLDQKAELPVPAATGHTFGSFSLLQGLPDSELKRKTAEFMAFRNALRVLYDSLTLADILTRHGNAVAEYGALLQKLSSVEPVLKERLEAQNRDARLLADIQPSDSFSHTEELLNELAAAHEWEPLREQAERHMESPDPSVALRAKRMLALSLAHSDEAADRQTAIALYQSLAAGERSDITDTGSLATLLAETGDPERAKPILLEGIAKFPPARTSYLAEIGQRIVEATGDRKFRDQLKAAIAERGQRE